MAADGAAVPLALSADAVVVAGGALSTVRGAAGKGRRVGGGCPWRSDSSSLGTLVTVGAGTVATEVGCVVAAASGGCRGARGSASPS